MGVAQNSLLGALTTAAAGAAAVGKVTADIDKASVEKMNKADSLQKEFLQTKQGMEDNDQLINHSYGVIKDQDGNFVGKLPSLTDIANAGNDRPAHRAGFTDRQAAQLALQQMQEKQLALKELNERRAQQYKQLMHRNIVGGGN